ncbi:MAG: chromosomal replication initiator protein DnaA [Planctomycetes bacterium]|jgi:chromosomal replication initiator protein|nr:chromosomal replication initiator protein DnaA [Planctomycetota bacterium]MBT4029344.1 chromosomal replication initiator protein DnaA [Planctomycetota bacterium]MBT4559788.1 chromosomal replication initiator protein DnaA [Planctomycetota bacterium]MBT5102284.1 chromosomal replication initiator protein DnaA [Planctomycetota bacterium]MBT5120150.1 chromosomal replication initiator protein DnaA [Planctomycetota bacterium]
MQPPKQTPLTEPWSQACEAFRSQLGVSLVDGFFKSASISNFQEGLLELQVPSALHQSRIAGHEDLILRHFQAEQLSFIVLDQDLRQRRSPMPKQTILSSVNQSAARALAQAPGAAVSNPLPQAPTLRPNYNFEHFVVGPCNQMAHAAANAVADHPAISFNPLFLHGNTGVGKTHLIQAIAHHLHKKQPELKILFLSCEQFTNHYIEAIRGGNIDAFRERYRSADVLIVDDIHKLSNKEKTQEEFFNTFNALHLAQKQVVLTSDDRPEEIEGLQAQLISRFSWGLVSEIDTPGTETRQAILQRKAEEKGIHIKPDVLSFMADLGANSVRELEGRLTKVQMHAVIERRPIDLALARIALRDDLRRTNRPIRMEDIIQVITEHYKVPLSDLQSKGRKASLMLPRQICMFLSRHMTSMSLVEIGHYFGGRDHSTVSNALKKINKRRQIETEFAQLLSDFDRLIRLI